MRKKLLFLLMVFMTAVLIIACGTNEEVNNELNDEAGETGNENSTEEEDETSTEEDSKPEKEEKEKLIMGTSADYPPFEFIDTAISDEIIGFDIDLAYAITEELGYELEIRDMDFGGLIPAIQSGMIDFAMSAMSPNEERLKNVDFSSPYYKSETVIVTKEGNGIYELDDLNGALVGVQIATLHEEMAEIYKETIDMTLDKRDRIPDMIQELRSDRFDAVLMAEVAAVGHLRENSELTSFIIPDPAPDPDNLGAGIVFPKDSDLTEEFDEVLLRMLEDGEIEELIEKWMRVD